jgi:hypothetical protein
MRRPTEFEPEVSLDLEFQLAVTTDQTYDDAVVPLSPDMLADMTDDEKTAALEWERSVMYFQTKLNNFQQGRKIFYDLLGTKIVERRVANAAAKHGVP